MRSRVQGSPLLYKAKLNLNKKALDFVRGMVALSRLNCELFVGRFSPNSLGDFPRIVRLEGVDGSGLIPSRLLALRQTCLRCPSGHSTQFSASAVPITSPSWRFLRDYPDVVRLSHHLHCSILMSYLLSVIPPKIGHVPPNNVNAV